MTQKTPEQRAHIHAVADVIENEPDSFDMDHYGLKTDCGTVMCIAGHSAHLTGDIQWLYDDDSSYLPSYGNPASGIAFGFACNNFGFDHVAGQALFIERGMSVAEAMPPHLRAKGMASALRDIAEGVDVDKALDDAAMTYGGVS